MHLSTGEENYTFGRRLRDERERLGFSQTALGDALGGKSKKTIINWEQDVSAPDASELLLMHSLRFNISYMLFGVVPGTMDDLPAYTPAEHAALAVKSLILTEDDAKMVVQVARRLSVDK